MPSGSVCCSNGQYCSAGTTCCNNNTQCCTNGGGGGTNHCQPGFCYIRSANYCCQNGFLYYSGSIYGCRSTLAECLDLGFGKCFYETSCIP